MNVQLLRQGGDDGKEPTQGKQHPERTSSTGLVRFEARWTDAGGTDRQQSYRTLDAALQAQAQRRADVTKGRERDEDKQATPFAEVAEAWLAWKRTTKVKPVTVERYAANLDLHALPYLGKHKVGRITTATLMEYAAHLSKKRTPGGYGLSPLTIKQAFIPVQQVLKYAALHGMLDSNPDIGIPLPQRNAAPGPRADFQAIPLGPDDVCALCDALDSRDTTPFSLDSLVVCFLASTGLRAAELAGLEIQDVNLLKKTLRVERTKTRTAEGWTTSTPKSKRSKRTIPLGDDLCSDLTAYLDHHPHRSEPTSPLFPSRVSTGGAGHRTATDNKHSPKKPTTSKAVLDWSSPIEPGTFLQRRLRPALSLAGLPEKVRLHDLRHSYGTGLHNEGVPVETISRLMGHASIAITHAIYVHAEPDAFHEEVNRLSFSRRKPAKAATVTGLHPGLTAVAP